MRRQSRHYIDGSWTESGGRTAWTVVNPASEEPCLEVMLGNEADVDAAVRAARRAFPGFAAAPLGERRALLERIVAVYRTRIDDLARAMAEEMGCPISFGSTAQAGAGLGHFTQAIDALDRFRFEQDHGGYKVLHEAIGVVALITPWNWPLNQIAAKVAPCLAVGNTMVLKPSEECPTVAIILAEILEQAGVPAGVFNLVLGDGAGVGTALSRHKDVDMVSFTGSTRAGIAVAREAAATVKRVHQELGGKTPNIVLRGTDIAAALPDALTGVIVNSGQSCIAPTRVLVHRSQHAEAARVVASVMSAVRAGDPLHEGPHIGPVVNAAQYEKIQGLMASAREQGATLEAGGTGRPDGMNKGYYVRPTVYSGVTPDMTIFREEVFGPVVTLTAYDTDDDAIALANDTAYGLSAVVTGEPERARAFMRGLRAGTVLVNGWAPSGGAPFGGYKQSGNGREFGEYGLREFTEVKAVFGEA